jgi:DNA-binding response OmpR family regulator
MWYKYIKVLFGWQKKVERKKVRGKNIEGLKANKVIKKSEKKSEMIIWLFGRSESECKVKGIENGWKILHK